jgi:hypothetical protein
LNYLESVTNALHIGKRERGAKVFTGERFFAKGGGGVCGQMKDARISDTPASLKSALKGNQ